MMVSVLVFNSTTLATSTLNVITVCIVTRVADVLSTRRSVSDAPLTKLVEENLCAFSKPLSQPTACVRRSSLCPRTPWFYRCTKRIWLIQTPAFSCINKTSRRFAAQAFSIRLRAVVSLDSNQRTRVVCACPTWIAPQPTQLYSQSASADTHLREQNIVM